MTNPCILCGDIFEPGVNALTCQRCFKMTGKFKEDHLFIKWIIDVVGYAIKKHEDVLHPKEVREDWQGDTE